VPGVFSDLRLLHLAGPTFAEASKEYPGAHFVGARMNFSADDFARLIAKIGYCAAVASVGLGAFTSTPIRNVILGKDDCINQYPISSRPMHGLLPRIGEILSSIHLQS
jgi:hypothetical protein